MSKFNANTISNELITNTLNIVTFLFAVFVIILVLFLWSGALHTAASYIHYLVEHDLQNIQSFNLHSIFLDFYYVPKIDSSKNVIEVLPIFFEAKDIVYFNYKTFTFYSIIDDFQYIFKPTFQMLVTNFFVLIQIPVFYFILKYSFRRLNAVGKLETIIQYKLDSDFLADDVTKTIASNIHHELKTPLSALEALIMKNKILTKELLSILGGCQNKNCIATKNFDKNQQEKNSDLITNNIKQQLDSQFELMRESILNMSATINMIGDLKVINNSKASIYDIIEVSLELFNIGSSYHFTYIIDPRFKMCYLDKLNQHALSNIIINHTKNSVEANAQIIKFELKDYVIRNKNHFLIFNIIDDGEGVPNKISDFIYDIRQTTKTYGTGVGLYICKKILNTYGGDERLAYTDKYGAVFELTLPIKECIRNKKSKE